MTDIADGSEAAAAPLTVTVTAAPLLSIVIPVFNEQAGLPAVLERLSTITIPHEFIVVDDGSSDGTYEMLEKLVLPSMLIYKHPENRGKGAALRTAFARAVGDIVLVQDADLEYDPVEYESLCARIRQGTADIVYGSRLMPESNVVMPRITCWANRFVTWCFNLCHKQKFTDVETCYKAIRRDILLRVLPTLEEDRFGIEIELTAKLLKVQGARIMEVPIRYQARSRRDGKKIRFRDGLRALVCIFKYR